MARESESFTQRNRRLMWTTMLFALAWTHSFSANPSAPFAGRQHLLVAGDLTVTIQLGNIADVPRFDETASVSAVTWHGHSFLGGAGLVDEFGLEGTGVLGYREAAAPASGQEGKS